MATKAEIVAYARKNVADHVDAVTGEVNLTLLGEDIAAHFSLELDDETPFEVAYTVGTAYERRAESERGE